MDRAALLKLSDPEVSTWNSLTGAEAPEFFGSCAYVVWPPVIDANVSKGDHPRHRGTPAMICQTMQVACGPNGATQAPDALFLSDCLIENDLEGTCFVCDKPRGRGGFACPRARAIALRLRFTRARAQA